MAPWFTVVIPTRDSAKWIGALLGHYIARSIKPVLLLDARTRDQTLTIARRLGIRIVDVTSFSSPEALVARTPSLIKTPWALFLNDDEVPSDALFDRLAGPPPPSAAQSVALARRWAWAVPGQRLHYGKSSHWPDRAGGSGNDHHWSLFQPSKTEFRAVWHSDGFMVGAWCRFPPAEYVIHFEWVLRTQAQRAAKIRRYDRYKAGFGSFFANMYLPEHQPEGLIQYHPFESGAYDSLAEAYFAARQPPLISACLSIVDKTRIMLSRVPPGDVMSKAEMAARAEMNPKPENEIACCPE